MFAEVWFSLYVPTGIVLPMIAAWWFALRTMTLYLGDRMVCCRLLRIGVSMMKWKLSALFRLTDYCFDVFVVF